MSLSLPVDQLEKSVLVTVPLVDDRLMPVASQGRE